MSRSRAIVLAIALFGCSVLEDSDSCTLELRMTPGGNIAWTDGVARMPDRVFVTYGTGRSECELSPPEGASFTVGYSCPEGTVEPAKLVVILDEGRWDVPFNVEIDENNRCHAVPQTVNVGLDVTDGQSHGDFSCEGDAVAFVQRWAGTYRNLVVRSTSGERCPSGTYTTLELTITSEVSEDVLRAKPCGVRLAAVSVQVSTDDGTLNESFSGWLTEEGYILGDHWLQVPTEDRILQLQGFGTLAVVDDCCVEPPDVLSDGVSFTSDLLTLHFWDLTASSDRTTELSISLSPSPPENACGTAHAAFELRTRDGAIAAEGMGELTFAPRSCAAEPCFAIDFLGTGAVGDTAALLGDADAYPGELTELDLMLSGDLAGTAIEVGSLACEVQGTAETGIVLSSEAP